MEKTKADVLVALKQRVKQSKIEDLLVISAGEFGSDTEGTAARVREFFAGDTVVVRSSSSAEDNIKSSNAGHYDSVLNVNSADDGQVINAIRQVIDSYRKDIENIENEQVLIQRQTKDTYRSGVIFSREIKYNRPYYMITYAEGSTDEVTSGKGGRTVYIYRNADRKSLETTSWFTLINAMRELEKIYPEYPLDVEFSVGSDSQITIFQARPLAASIDREKWELSEKNQADIMDIATKDYEEVCFKEREVAALSDMAFWNPAEMIGENPHPMDYSIYRDIITRKVWTQSLNNLGYRTVENELMYKIGNKAYICLESAFKGLTPSGINDSLTEKLTRYYRKCVEADPSCHDKIEFEVVLSSFDFTTMGALRKMQEAGFTKEETEEIEKALTQLTERAIKGYSEQNKKDMQGLKGLMVHREIIDNNLKMVDADLHTLIQSFEQIMESIKHYGTTGFTRQARYAFMATSLRKSMEKAGYISKEDMKHFMSDVKTVASRYEADYKNFSMGKLSKKDFLYRYGHLRSNTYDITSDTYNDKYMRSEAGGENLNKIAGKMVHEASGEMVHEVFEETGAEVIDKNYNDITRSGAEAEDNKIAESMENRKNTLPPGVWQSVSRELCHSGIDVSEEEFCHFLKDSLCARELFKFEFTKSLSLGIDILIMIGNILQVSREDMAYLSVKDIMTMASMNEKEAKKYARHRIEDERRNYSINSQMLLPEVIFGRQQLWQVEIMEARPNFVTTNVVSGEVVVLDDYSGINSENLDIEGKIVALTKADPGYDWIFTKGIKGFITKYGGAASHMAIRCAEFNVPAAIGCGKKLYGFVERQKYITIDCKEEKIREGEV
jgi:phosphohistidine swiveling domain-containing protein